MIDDPYTLDRLRDIVEPAMIAPWPPAPGAWLVLALVLTWTAVIAVRVFVFYRANAYRRRALRLLDGIARSYREDGGKAVPAAVGELLKRVALTVYPRRRVASLSGEAWLGFLDRSSGLDLFSRGAGRVLGGSLYDSRAGKALSSRERNALFAAARRWILEHRPEAAS